MEPVTPASPPALSPSASPSGFANRLFPPIESPENPNPECHAISSSLRVFANRNAVFNYLSQELTNWRLDPYLLTYKKAKKAAQKALVNNKQSQQSLQNYLADRDAGIALLDGGVIQGYAETSLAYAAAAQAYMIVTEIQLNTIPADDTIAKTHATYAQEHPLACKEEDVNPSLEADWDAMNRWAKQYGSNDENIKAVVTQAHEATSQAQSALVTAREAAALAKTAFDQEKPALAQDYVLSAKRYADSAKAYAKCAQRYAKTAHAHDQALREPTEHNRQIVANFQASAAVLQKQAKSMDKRAANLLSTAITADNYFDKSENQNAVNSYAQIALRYLSKATKWTMREIRSISATAGAQIARRAQPLTRRLPSETAVKESVFQYLTRHLPRLTSTISRLACFFFTAPLSAIDLYLHAFWCATKFSLLVIRGAIYILTFGHYGVFLQDHVSIEQVGYHAKKVALFTINMFFGPLLGLVNPSALIKQQTRYKLTAQCNQFELV